ncbi:hypothetical protein CVM52_13350 [Pseudooceanicola lipolyticus]|uniref:DUF2244 domain-containing protein n=1 Tax=Pseudooceanicola lipolyticus TaxID=2029104 RepID=A0A2M8J064_9RHOB|nr:hypothetical protein [Pseudooceanicola lipolyticus]PJE36171.1 hypothetical protein CVM52_13350 [Pseudooceanicola lipolyticus]
MDDEVLAVARASAPRRWIGIAMVVAVAAVTLYVAFSTPPADLSFQVLLVLIGLGALWMAEVMRRSTELTIELTRSELRDSSGTCIARIEDITAVERGLLAFKPSNGFMLKTRTPGPRVWRPGIWWRIGRRVGIGGVMPGHQTKAMAEILAALQAERG